MNSSDKNECGLLISVQNEKNDANIKISGKYSISLKSDIISKVDEGVARNLVLVVTRGGNYVANKPLSDVVLFSDDVVKHEEFLEGKFLFSLFEHIKLSGQGEFYVHCSLGTYLSNTLKITIK